MNASVIVRLGDALEPPSKRRKRGGAATEPSGGAPASRAESLRYLSAEQAKSKLNDAQRLSFVERSVEFATRCSALIHRFAALSEELGCAKTAIGSGDHITALAEEGMSGVDKSGSLAQASTLSTMWHAVAQTVAQLERKAQAHTPTESGLQSAGGASASVAVAPGSSSGSSGSGASAPAPIVEIFMAEMSRCFGDELAELRSDRAFEELEASAGDEEAKGANSAVTMLLNTLESNVVTLEQWERAVLLQAAGAQ
jgi:hypothetical protein